MMGARTPPSAPNHALVMCQSELGVADRIGAVAAMMVVTLSDKPCDP
jgi:hypothetical protein